jgi:hypothetical protein
MKALKWRRWLLNPDLLHSSSQHVEYGSEEFKAGLRETDTRLSIDISQRTKKSRDGDSRNRQTYWGGGAGKGI